MSLKSFFNQILGIKAPVVIQSFTPPATWTPTYRFELHTFMKTDAGKALYQHLRSNVIQGQINACKPDGKATADERMANANGKEEFLRDFIVMFNMPEEYNFYKFEQDDANTILHKRINGDFNLKGEEFHL